MNSLLDICSLALGDNWRSLHSLAYYSHLIPIFFSMFLSTLVFLKARKNILSKIFLVFATVFSLWLIGDLIAWTSSNYYLIYASWSLLDYLEIIFYVLGLYFTGVLVNKYDLSLLSKILLFIATLVPLFITITQKSVTGFNYPVCEAFNSDFLGQYKLYLEILILGIVFMLMLVPFMKKETIAVRKTHLVVLGSMFLFMAVFGTTEYLASVTGYYEMNLYALFVIPIFLMAMTYSVFNLDIFNLKILSTYFLVFGFLILIGSQFFFVVGTSNKLLTVLTLVLSVGFSSLLFRNLRRESEQRIHIEKLNIELGNLIKQRESLVHLVTHKVKGAFTRSKYIFAGMVDGTFGEISAEIKKRAQQGLESDNSGIQTVDLVLNVSNMQTGKVKYEMQPINFKDIATKSISEKMMGAEAKGFKIENDLKEGNYGMSGDAFWLKEAINNLIENSIKYTQAGKITVSLENRGKNMLFSVKDTGIGITDEDKKNLFTEGGRGKDSMHINVDSTGYGLFSVKLIVEAHKGRVWGESGGSGKGSQFYIELPVLP